MRRLRSIVAAGERLDRIDLGRHAAELGLGVR